MKIAYVSQNPRYAPKIPNSVSFGLKDIHASLFLLFLYDINIFPSHVASWEFQLVGYVLGVL